MRLVLCGLIVFVCFFGGPPEAGSQCTRYKVRIDTSSFTGLNGQLVLELTSSVGNTVDYDYVEILDYEYDANTPRVRTYGGVPGLVTASSVGGRIVDPFTNGNYSSILGRYGFLNGVAVEFDSLGTFINFDVDFIDQAGTSIHPTEFSAFLLGANDVPSFDTEDPLGSNSFFTISSTSGCEEIEVFAPATFVSPDSIHLDLGDVTGANHRPPRLEQLRFVRVAPNPSKGRVSFEYYAPEGKVTVRLFDVQGRLLFEASDSGSNGTERFEWSGTGNNGKRVGPGIYFAQLTNDRKTVVRKVVMLH